ncbi:MAG: hypothetical protein MUD10_03820 [Candidatus Pacebacteria bacterium]|jgi:hypothetical protein|nr:hypothetical protein [Candidatus Paceibacterota bacterium]
MNLKKTFYVLCTMVLCLLLASIAHGLIENWYIDSFLAQGTAPVAGAFGYKCFLPWPITVFLPLAAIIGGYFLGQSWWKIIYVERRFAKRRFDLFKLKH